MVSMTELLQEFEQKRETIRQVVEDHVTKRDRAAEEAVYNAQQRDILNSRVKEMREQVKQLIAEKSALIEQVQKLRPEKEKLYAELSEIRKEYRKVRDNAGVEGIDPRDIRKKERDLQHLIKRQETTALEKNEEIKVVSEIRKLTNEIKKLKSHFETELERNDQVKQINSEIAEKRKTAEAMKKDIEQISNRISEISDQINAMLQELDETRRKSDEFHEAFIKYNQESEKEHQSFIQAKTDLRDLEKVIYGIRSKERTSRKKEKEGELQKRASTLFERFKNGEQLTTEDLLILQKAGFL